MAENASKNTKTEVGVGLIGCGTVGTAVVRMLDERRELIERQTGVAFSVRRIAVRDLTKDRGLPVASDVYVDDPAAVVDDAEVDVVVELIGGLDPAGELVLRALKAEKPVVTANKELMAAQGARLLEAAESAGVDLLFEAAVGGGIPVIRPITESLAGEEITRVLGIVNGTTNYILTRMSEEGAEFADVLADAQRLGYAEADPAADVEGYDARAKATILATLAFGTHVDEADVFCEGITAVTARDVRVADKLGYVIKPLAIAEFVDSASGPSVSVRVHPAMLPLRHPLSAVRLSLNAVFVEGESSGETMFLGHGAGGGPTAVSVVGDIVDAALNLRQSARGPHAAKQELHPLLGIDEIRNQFYLRLDVRDEPGVLASVASAFGDNNVSIKSVVQEGHGDDAELVLITHHSREDDMACALGTLADLEVMRGAPSMIRVVGDEDAPVASGDSDA